MILAETDYCKMITFNIVFPLEIVLSPDLLLLILVKSVTAAIATTVT